MRQRGRLGGREARREGGREVGREHGRCMVLPCRYYSNFSPFLEVTDTALQPISNQTRPPTAE